MVRKKHVILLVLAACLCLPLLAGCGYFEFQKEKREMVRLASERALAYVDETFGGSARVVDVEVGTYTVIFSAAIGTNALVTVSLDGEEFQVYVETREPQFCADNRSGLALAQALDEYFRGLYGLPPALEHRVRVISTDEGFFAHGTTNLAYEYSFLDFDYHGQPLEEVLPLLDKVYFDYDYVDDSVSLERVELREEDWGGPVERIRVWARCFRCYEEDSEIPVGIQAAGDRPVMMAEGMVFSKRGQSSYGSLSDIAGALSGLALREALYFEGGKTTRQHYTITRMGNFWVTTQEGFTAEECYELRPCEPGWADSVDLWARSIGAYYTREEILDGENTPADVRKALQPFLDARFQPVGEMLCLREGVAERIEAWREERKGWSLAADKFPLAVTVIPSLVYQSDAYMGAGRTWEEQDGIHHAADLFLSYLDQKDYWTHGLSRLTFYAPGDLVLLRTAK